MSRLMAEATLDAGPLVTGPWLVRLRWAAVLAQVIGVAVAVRALGLTPSLPPIVSLIVVLALSNLALGRWLARRQAPPPRVFGAVLALDIALLTALLWFTGGTSNPFTTVYLVYIALAAVTLGSRWTWTTVALSVIGYGTLFAIAPLADPHALHQPRPDLSGHLAGMWVAFVSAALLIGFFVTRVREALDQRERALEDARRLAAARDRLASLTTLAAGAAHELATPLATIAVASTELVREAGAAGRGDLIEDARLIRSQVERCRQILDHMSGRADASAADPPAALDPAVVVREAIEALPAGIASRLRVSVEGPPTSVRIPRVGAARALTTLIKNALEASDEGSPVDISVTTSPTTLAFAVRDRGRGIDDATLARAGEPFFTTKPAGAGFGLGLFLVRTFAEQWGGRFTLSSRAADGTEASLSFTADGRTA
ncbi:MAG: HAMP domain-containing histidine kinase [Acidobacteria bacterium]|nr:HAMP domain-containing histidine kinase [Acidobacteriota bacterium]